jgi:Raf kinase inhibitor-like YbhB/YbcL family protein
VTRRRPLVGHTRANRPPETAIPAASKVRRIKGWVLLVAVVLAGCSRDSSELPRVPASGTLTVTSPAFEDGESIPTVYTCAGAETSPPLDWKGSDGAHELALTMTDPDASFTHWVAWGLPGSVTGVEQGRLPAGATEGTNDFGDASYGGPCPPEGDDPHHYVFTIYALDSDATAGLDSDAGIDELLGEIACCTIAKGSLTGLFARPAA